MMVCEGAVRERERRRVGKERGKGGARKKMRLKEGRGKKRVRIENEGERERERHGGWNRLSPVGHDRWERCCLRSSYTYIPLRFSSRRVDSVARSTGRHAGWSLDAFCKAALLD